MTPAGTLAAQFVIHAVSLDRDRRTSATIIDTAVRSAFARARENSVTSIAFPAIGTGVGGFPLDEAALVTVKAVRDELPGSSGDPARDLRDARCRGLPGVRDRAGGNRDAGGRAVKRRRRVSFPYEPTEEQRDELVEQVAREIQLRGLTGPAVHFLQASRPYRPLGANAMLFFDPVLRACSAAASRAPRRSSRTTPGSSS